MKFFILVVTTYIVAIATYSDAAVSKNILHKDGFISGGTASSAGVSIIDMQIKDLKGSAGERIIFNIGDKNGLLLKGHPGYFHIEKTSSPSQFSIDFDQVMASNIDLLELQKKIKNSKNIASAKLLKDPEDGSLHFTFKLKSNIKMKVYQVSGVQDTSKVVIDLIQ